MKKLFKSAIILFLTQTGCVNVATHKPSLEKIDKKLEKHGYVRHDPYYWVKEKNSKVIDYLNQENDYLEDVLSPVKSTREQLFDEMKSRVIEDESSAPLRKGKYDYVTKYNSGSQYPVYFRRNIDTKEETILVDVTLEAQNHAFYESSGPIISYDQNLMAHAFDTVGRRFYTLKIKDLEKDEWLDHQIPNIKANVVWSKNPRYLFYSQGHPETLRSYQIYRYDLLEKKSTLIYEEKDETFEVYLNQSLAKDYIYIVSNSTLTTEVRYIKANEPTQNWTVFQPRERGHEYEVVDAGDRFYIKTNWHSPNFKMMETSLDSTSKKHWKDVIPETSAFYIEDLVAYKDFVVLSQKNKGLDQFKVWNRKTKKDYLVPFKDQAYGAEASVQEDYNKPTFRFTYESLRQPEQTFSFNLESQKSTLIKERIIPNFDSTKYQTSRIWIKSRDGQDIPVSLLMSKNHVSNGQAPALLYGYGSYGVSLTPWFSQSIFSLIDRGFVYAIIHVRGGAELGRKWYEDGRTQKKMNTFYDFIDVTEELIKQKVVSSKKIFAMGGSAGGLLMGAIANLRPDLFAGVVAQVPFVDVLTTMLDDTIPLTTSEYDEWGNPNEKKAYDYMKLYSPYDNVQPKPYPNILVTSGLHDSQVQYWEPTKWVLKLRENNQSDSLILLKTDMDAGHGGASGRYEKLKEKALEYSFMLKVLENMKN